MTEKYVGRMYSFALSLCILCVSLSVDIHKWRWQFPENTLT